MVVEPIKRLHQIVQEKYSMTQNEGAYVRIYNRKGFVMALTLQMNVEEFVMKMIDDNLLIEKEERR